LPRAILVAIRLLYSINRTIFCPMSRASVLPEVDRPHRELLVL
jgi:hypothetical protein